MNLIFALEGALVAHSLVQADLLLKNELSTIQSFLGLNSDSCTYGTVITRVFVPIILLPLFE